jgi:hypothetical protein
MPRKPLRQPSLRQDILVHGKLTTVTLDAHRFRPYPRQPARIENLCGSFRERIFRENFATALVHTPSCFGDQPQLHHLEGNVTICGAKACFMGARSFEGLARLSRAMRLSEPKCVVYIGVFCVKLGVRIQVSPGGLLETNLRRHAGTVRVEGQLLENNNSLRFDVGNFEREGPFALEPAYRPAHNDWTVTSKGTVILRMNWSRIEWSQQCEDACLRMCERAADALRECCVPCP